jgi:hypothetical protein
MESEQIADSARLIVVAFPSASARRSSAYVWQMIAYWCGGFPPLAEDPVLSATAVKVGIPRQGKRGKPNLGVRLAG